MENFITNEIIESFLQCQYKYSLKRCGEKGEISGLETLYNQQKKKKSLFLTYAEKIQQKGKTSVISNTPLSEKLFSKQFDFILQAQIIQNGSHLQIDFLEKVTT